MNKVEQSKNIIEREDFDIRCNKDCKNHLFCLSKTFHKKMDKSPVIMKFCPFTNQ